MFEPGATAGGSESDLGASISQLMGDFGSGDEPSPSDESAAGAPPAATEPSSATSTPAPDGAQPPAAPSAHAEPAPAATPPADAAAPADDDPLATSTPLTYTVDGQQRTIEGIRRIGDEAIITKDALEDVTRRLGERDHLFEQGQRAWQERQQFDAMAAWKTAGADGQEQILTGAQGLAEMRVSHARLEATLSTLVGALQDPAQFAQLVAVNDQNQIVANADFLNGLVTKAELAEMKAEQATRSLLGQLAHAAQPQPAAPDFSKVAPQIIQSAAGDDFARLNARDQQVLAQQMPRYIRPSTAQERQQGHGPHIVDAAFAEIVKDRIALRAEQAQVASTSSAAAASNAARLAAARAGQAKPTATPHPTRTPPAEETLSDADRAWAMRERMVSGVRR